MSAVLEHMPDGRPAPAVMTDIEAARFLRLTEDRTDDCALKSLRRLVDQRKLRPCRVGKCNRYSRAELLRFVERETQRAFEVDE